MNTETRNRVAGDVVQRESVKSAQAALGVMVDGFFGPRTLAAVLALVALVKKYEDILDVPPSGLAEGPQPQQDKPNA